MALNEEMQNIIKTIHIPIVLFIPEYLFPNLDLKHIEELENIGLFNNLFGIDKNGKPHSIDKDIKYISILNKSKILKSSIFQLLEMKAKLADSTFLYLLKDYLKETDTWVTLTEQIKNRAKLETINYNPLYQPYIDLQYQTLIEHQLELKSHFGDWKSKIELERILNRVGLTTKKNVVNKKVSSKKQNITELKQNKVKVYLLNEECDNYLLKNVFNVKID